MTARLDYWNREFDTAFRRLRWHLRYDELIQRAEAFADVLRKYAPDQPRIPAGQTGGGQWTVGGGLVRVAGGFKARAYANDRAGIQEQILPRQNPRRPR